MEEGVRIDKWLWAVRLYKTRSIATEACKAGRVMVNDLVAKPSRDVRKGDVIKVHIPPIRKTVRVLELLEKRLAAKNLTGFIEDLTPEEEYLKLRSRHESAFEYRQPGTGRPTKKSRREIDVIKKFLGQ